MRLSTRWLPWIALLPWLLWAGVALARVGGGQSFGGGGGGGGGGGFSGGGGGEGDILLLILELVIRYPKVGVPLLVVFVLFLGVRNYWENSSGRRVVSTHGGLQGRAPVRAPRARAVPGLAALRKRDKGFSLPVLKDFLVLVHRRAFEAATTKEWEPLTPFVDPGARKALSQQVEGLDRITEVVVGSVQPVQVATRGRYDHLRAQYDGTRLEIDGSNTGRRYRVKEIWTFRRLTQATSLAPEAVHRMGCPSCGASIETTRLGACANCDTPITAGQLQWQLTDISVRSRKHYAPPEVGLFAGGDEPSVHYPTVEAPDLAARLRELQGMHPDFSIRQFGERVTGIYHGLQDAWSGNRWQDARPWVTDTMYDSLRFWTEQYTEHGLRNELADVRLTRLKVVKVEIDAWYESITIRIWGSMKDSVVDRNGEVVGGNPNKDRNFSEYWTFLRAAGSGGQVHDAKACPSCGAPLDRIGQNGECGYCNSIITTGRFDWVLSSIEQCETYNGG